MYNTVVCSLRHLIDRVYIRLEVLRLIEKKKEKTAELITIIGKTIRVC